MMRTGIFFNYAGGFREAVDQVVELEKIGVDIALVAEAYSYDAISQLGYLAAKTSTIELGTGVVPIYIRTPTLLAMTAAGLDYVSDGRFRLGDKLIAKPGLPVKDGLGYRPYYPGDGTRPPGDASSSPVIPGDGERAKLREKGLDLHHTEGPGPLNRRSSASGRRRTAARQHPMGKS